MTALTLPSVEPWFLQAIREEVVAGPIREWDQRSLRLCLKVLRKLREHTAEVRQALASTLSEGVEGRSFARDYGPLLPGAEERVGAARELVGLLSPAEDAASQSVLAELALLEQEERAFRDLLAEALSKASEPPPPIDWARLKRESDAAFAAGRFVTFETPEDMLKGLGGGD